MAQEVGPEAAAFKGLPTKLTEPQYDQEFQGTLFRLPFRTPALAAASEISQVVIGQSEVEQMSREFCDEAHLYLLFLRTVTEIEFFASCEALDR